MITLVAPGMQNHSELNAIMLHRIQMLQLQKKCTNLEGSEIQLWRKKKLTSQKNKCTHWIGFRSDFPTYLAEISVESRRYSMRPQTVGPHKHIIT